MKKLTKLTEEQKAAIPGWVKDWIQKGLKTGEADWDRFERGIRKAYKFAGLDGEKLEIIRCQSPLEVVTEGPRKAAIAEGIPKNKHNEYIKNNWHKYIGGQGWISWVAYTNFYKDVCHLELEGDIWERNEAYTDMLCSAWWCWPHKDFVMVSNRPVEIHLDDQSRLHCENAKAIHWPDGWGIYKWHGVEVPEKIIMNPEGYTLDEIKEITNTEHVRVLAERLGWDKYLERIGASTIDKWTDSNTGLQYELVESAIRFGELEPRFLRKQSSVLKDGSQPWYLEPVHASLKTAQAARKFQAMAAFVDNDENEYAQLIEHCNKDPELRYDWES